MPDSYIRDPVTGQEKRVIDGDCEIRGQMDVNGPMRNYGAPVVGGSGISGSGTGGVLPKFIAADEVGDSRISDSGSGPIELSTDLLLAALTAVIQFGSGFEGNLIGYANGVGPRFTDGPNVTTLTFNLQSLSSDRAFTWPNRSATVATTTGSLTVARMARFDASGNLIQSEVLVEGSGTVKPPAADAVDLGAPTAGFRQLYLSKTMTPAATTGDQEINKAAGSVNFAALAAELTVTCDKCTEDSLVFAVIATNDSAAIIKNVVPGNGSFTIRLSAAANAETRVSFWVLN